MAEAINEWSLLFMLAMSALYRFVRSMEIMQPQLPLSLLHTQFSPTPSQLMEHTPHGHDMTPIRTALQPADTNGS